jgi:hypothetical protein
MGEMAEWFMALVLKDDIISKTIEGSKFQSPFLNKYYSQKAPIYTHTYI